MHLLALVSDAFGGHGGIAQYNRDLLTALGGSAGHRVLVLVRYGAALQPELPPSVRQIEPKGKAGFALTAFRVARLRPFDAIFCGHINLVPLAAAIAALLRRPLWLQLHGREAWGPLPRIHRRAAERAALVTAVSRHTRRRFLGLARVDPSRVYVLPNTVGAQFKPGPKPARLLDEYQLHGKRVLLTVGRLAAAERGKGHDRVLEALRALRCIAPDLVYLIAGDGDDRDRLRRRAAALGIADQVRFSGMVMPSELPDYYRAADVFAMPSTQEGFGIVFLEAAASGLRVVAGNCDGSVDALADGVLGRLLDPTDCDALVAAIGQALAAAPSDPDAVRRFAFENFAGHVGKICDLLPHAARA